MNIHSFTRFIILSLLTLSLYSCSEPKTSAPGALSADSIAQIVQDAYIYSYPIYIVGRLEAYSKGKRIYNKFSGSQRLYTAKDSAAGTNNETPYFAARLDLEKEPLVLHVPDHQSRYYSLQFYNIFGENVDYIGTRKTGNKEARYLLTAPGWKGVVPEGVTAISFSTPFVSVLGRTLVHGEDDLPNVVKLQNAVTLTPLSEYPAKEGQYEGEERNDIPVFINEPDSFFVNINNALTKNPPPADEQELFARFKKAGIGPGEHWDWKKFDDSTQLLIRQKIKEADQLLDSQSSINYVHAGNNWLRTNPKYGKYGKDYLTRAVIFRWGGIAGHSEEEAIYFFDYTDDKSDSLSGDKKYILHFEKGQTPPVKGYWSVILYALGKPNNIALPGLFLVDNPQNRYSFGSRIPNKANPDGSIDFYIQSSSPGKDKESNWLPSPKNNGRFTLCGRTYLPEVSVLNGEYKLPALKRAD